MSHQNAEEKNTTTSESTPKTDRELATALRAMALATQDQSPIFQLNVDCWEEIFGWLSVDDVHALGQTCKCFYQIAGKYFKWKYRRVLVQDVNNEMKGFWKDLPGFNEFAQRYSVFYSKKNTSLSYASANCKSPKEFKFLVVRSTDQNVNCLEKILASVEVLTFGNSFISDEFMESILKLCEPNLKRLTIGKTTRCDWMHHKYPKLEHLALHEFNSAPELVKFFEANPNVHSFSTTAQNILEHQKEFMASTIIKLDDLTVLGYTAMDGVPDALIDLYNHGFYKRLHFVTFTKKHLVDLPGLTTLDFGTSSNIDVPHLPTVTRLFFKPMPSGYFSFLRLEEVTNALPNLECVVMSRESIKANIMPFIRNSKKLKEIKTQYFRNGTYDVYDPVLMNSEREKLNGAHKVTIYVAENDYLRIKWKYNRTDFGLIEIKRNECYDGMLDHGFDQYLK